jgi:hypothetical protein
METGVIVMFGRIQVEEESAIAAVGGRVGGVPQSSKLKLLFNALRSIDQQPGKHGAATITDDMLTFEG